MGERGLHTARNLSFESCVHQSLLAFTLTFIFQVIFKDPTCCPSFRNLPWCWCPMGKATNRPQALPSWLHPTQRIQLLCSGLLAGGPGILPAGHTSARPGTGQGCLSLGMCLCFSFSFSHVLPSISVCLSSLPFLKSDW